MSLRFDLHIHTEKYSPCSRIPPERLVAHALRVGLDGVVITEHHYQWTDEDLEPLRNQARETGLVLLAGFELSTSEGDLLIYGLDPEQVARFVPYMDPEPAITLAHTMGAVVVAAHPTRRVRGFDTRMMNYPLDAMEVASCSLETHEQHLARRVADAGNFRKIAASDAHDMNDVGRFFLLFEEPVRDQASLKDALLHGKFTLPEYR